MTERQTQALAAAAMAVWVAFLAGPVRGYLTARSERRERIEATRHLVVTAPEHRAIDPAATGAQEWVSVRHDGVTDRAVFERGDRAQYHPGHFCPWAEGLTTASDDLGDGRRAPMLCARATDGVLRWRTIKDIR